MTSPRVLVVGGAGYIGSHMVKMLGRLGCQVTTLDDLSSGHRDAVLAGDFVQGSCGDRALLEAVLSRGFDGVMHFASFIQDQQQGKLQLFNAGWVMDYPDPEDVLDLKFHSKSALNDIGYVNTEADRLLEQARTERNPEARIKTYQQVEQLLLQDGAWLPLYFGQRHQVVNSAVKGWIEPPMVLPRLRFVEVTR